MGQNQSDQQGTSIKSENSHGITIVNSLPEQNEIEEKIFLPERVLPILSVEGHLIDPKRHSLEFQLDRQIWVDVVKTIDRFANSRAELVATRQSQLQEKIILVDDMVQRFTDSYINDKHKALAKLNDDCRKMTDINKMLDKCTIQSELCVDMLNKLNFLLPATSKLESLENKGMRPRLSDN